MPDKGWATLCSSLFLVLTAMTLTIIRAQTMPQNGDIRLVNVNDSTNMTGRLEVFYDGQWGTVCDDFFDTYAAAVVCRQLGFSPDGALVVVRAGYGQGTGNISLDNVFCFGSEQTIGSCFHNGWGSHNCDHSQDVGIICLSPNATQPPIQVRLVDGADEHEGRVEILYAGLWGGICLGFLLDLGSANVICRQLGYPGAMRVAEYLEFGAGSGQIWLTDLYCTGTENSLEECPHDGFGTGSCFFPGDDVGIECMEITPPPQFSVRLIGGSTEYEGRVEFYYNDQWGTVCNDSWDINDAEVVCRQLHFTGANEALGSAPFGAGTGPIWLYDVLCTGSERELSECPHNTNNSFGNHNCNHQQDAGVRCTAPKDFDVRLRNGSTHSEGRVDVYYDRQWGAICDYGWDINDAVVICRQLGYVSALRPTINSAYPVAENSLLWLDFVSCHGNESSIQFCAHSGWGITDCGFGNEAGVICTNETLQHTQTVQVRLINNGVVSSSTGLGRVEVLHDGLWGTVCDDNWDFLDAFVVCQQLGFSAVEDITLFSNNVFGSVNNSVPIWLDNIHCIGNETNLGLCPHFGFGVHDCSHYEDSGVNCSNDAVNTNISIRLVGSNNSNEGRVEVFFNGEWGTVCDDFWGLTDANVVCAQLGFIRALATPRSTQFGEGSGRIWMDDVQCLGSESKLWDCSFNGWGQHNCFHYEDASVICEDLTTAPDTPFAVRIVGGARQYEGRVEIYNDNFNGWGTICNQNWDRNDADVVCRQLGYDGSLELQSYGPGSGPVYLTNVQCEGTEPTLVDCGNDGWNNVSGGCLDHSLDAGVVCNSSSVTCNDGDIRLVNGSTDYDGLLEVCYLNRWGTICGDFFGDLDAQVACRQLGLNTDQASAQLSFGYGLFILLANVQCRGGEDRLVDCVHSGFGDNRCFHFADAGIICPPAASLTLYPPGTVRLVDGDDDFSGRVEIFWNGVWGTVCDDFWDLADARVVCRQLGFRDARQATTFAFHGPGIGLIWLDNVLCFGNETELQDCQSNGFGDHNCIHIEDAGVVCTNVSVPITVSVRVQEGTEPYNGRVEVMYNGEWGTICNMGWDLNDARAFCRQLGYVDATATGLASNFGYNASDGRIWQTNVDCTGQEKRFGECLFTETWGDTDSCNHNMDVGVQCSSMRRESFPITLVNGDVPSEGRLLVLINGTYGAVCDDFFGYEEAQVACRQLNYTNAIRVAFREEFGSGDISEPIYFDDVICDGNESNLYECSYSDSHNCIHSEDVGIVCNAGLTSCDAGALRLVNGDQTEGRVEICLNNVWGTICDDFWDINDARVVCRQLGFPSVVRPTRFASFGVGTGPIHLDDVMCLGNETRLEDCSHNGVGNHNCFHFEDAGVECSYETLGPFPVRLVDGMDETEGRVEIFYNGEWGTICDDFWGFTDADVVCREIGCPYGAIEAPRNAEFGEGTGTIWLDNVHCTGTELYLSDCVHNGWGIENCFHSEDAGVRCNRTDCDIPGRNRTNLDIRLANGNQPGSGRVEIFANGQWGTICDVFWGLADAEVACRDLGYTGALAATGGGYFGQGIGPIHRTEVLCQGFEPNLLICPSKLNTSSCDHSLDAGVICIVTPPCEEGSIRLRDESQTSTLAGRVEICINNQWSAICNDGWTDLDAVVACRQLGQLTSTSQKVYQTAVVFGQGDGPILIANVSCLGNEEAVRNCSFNLKHDCPPDRIAGAQCGTLPLLPTRLAGGSVDGEGRVEVYYNDQWGTVCDDEWDLLDAAVVCSQLGFVGAVGATTNSFFDKAEQNVSIQFDEVQCIGTEQSLDQCTFTTDHNCDHTEEAGVICIASGVSGVRLIGDAPGAGRVEVNIDGFWSTVCNDGWSLTESDVVCKQLGFTRAINYTTGSTTIDMFGAANPKRPIVTGNVGCTGQETSLSSCPGFDPNAPTQCSSDHSQDVGVVCLSIDRVQLSDGTNTSGRVELFFNGRWGTVCDDKFDKLSGQVICDQLNLGYIARVASPGEFPVGRSDQPIWFDEVHCTGNEKWLSACTHSGYGTNDCKHNEDVAIVCTGLEQKHVIQGLRLAGGNSLGLGRVEVKINDIWAQICGDSWTTEDATVVCHYLGFNDVQQDIPEGNIFGISSSGYWLTEMQCSGDENDLNQCPHTLYNTSGPIPTCAVDYPANVNCLGTVVVSPGRQTDKNKNDNNEDVLIGVLVPVLLIVLAITAVVIIAIIYLVKRSRQHRKADDTVHYLSPDDNISFDSTFSKGTSGSKDTTSTTGFANPLYSGEQPDELPDKEHDPLYDEPNEQPNKENLYF